MTAPRQRTRIEPYNLTWAQVAESVFQRSESWLRANIDRYIKDKGFPGPDKRFDGALFNKTAIEAWVDGPYGHSTSALFTIEQTMMEEAARGA